MSKADVDAELATVPEPQRPLAAMLPLAGVPEGWEVAKSGERHLETFNADNLFEKIDGRAESFLQYDVKGMAYTYYHPAGDDSNEVQLYIFEFPDSLKALGKYGSEKPGEGATPIEVGSEGYTAAGSTLFYAGRYYTQIVATKDDAKFSAFALELARRVAARQKPPATASAGGQGGKAEVTPETLFALLPAEPRRSGASFVPQDVFGYSFLSDVFMADYKDGDVAWQGFLRPYASPDEAKAVFEKYLSSVKQDGADLKEVQAEGAERMVVSSNIGLVDVVFLKGNAVGGANGATDAAKAEAFARSMAKALPEKVPMIDTGKNSATESTEEEKH
jgi:hypothetical protein